MSIELFSELEKLENKMDSFVRLIENLKAENIALKEGAKSAAGELKRENESLKTDNDELKKQLVECNADLEKQRGKSEEVAGRIKRLLAKFDSAQ